MKHRPGVTMIELLIVLVIMGILASIVALRTRVTTEKAHLAVVQSDLRSLATAQELYYHKSMMYGELEHLEDYDASDGVTVEVTWAASDGFAATGRHAAVHDVTCGVFQGPAAPGSAGPAVEEGQVTCE